MNRKKFGAATIAAIAVAATVAGCGTSDDATPKNVSWSPVTGDNFTTNPGAWHTDGVPAPAAGITMVGNPVAAQATANAGLPQGTITASTNNTTVYYPPAPVIKAIPAVSVQANVNIAPPMQRPANTVPWHYTPQQIEIYQQICRTGTYRDYNAGIEIQQQTCYTLYGRQLGVRPWVPGQPVPWHQPSWPTPWFEAGFHADVPVMWVYPPSWTAPKPQPLISVSIGLNIGGNPYAQPNPAWNHPYVPVWAVTPGLTVEAKAQATVQPPWLPWYTNPSVNISGEVTIAPTFPGVVLAPIPTSGEAEIVTALPGANISGNVNTDAAVLVPTAAALQGATIYSGSAADLRKVVGDDVKVRVASEAELKGSEAPATATANAESGATTKSEATTKADDEGTPAKKVAPQSADATAPAAKPGDATTPKKTPSSTQAAPTQATTTEASKAAPTEGTTAAPVTTTTKKAPAPVSSPAQESTQAPEVTQTPETTEQQPTQSAPAVTTTTTQAAG